MNWKERRYSASLSPNDTGRPVTLYGWIDTIRDHGHLLFCHLRDIRGVVQLVFNPETDPKSYKTAQHLRNEYVVEVQGLVTRRSEDTVNPHIPTGTIEVTVQHIRILNESDTPPFLITEKDQFDTQENSFNVDEDIRLKYRFLDLRRPSMQQNIIKRSQLIKLTRDYLDSHGFLDIETPVLTKSTPEGARDYLVPSRVHEGKFYALPQSPQLFKQLLMVSGMDRYYQVVKCFRDEDLRPNRQPEFTQIDLEASFIDEEFIISLIEELIVKLYRHENLSLPTPFPRMTYTEAMDKYGSDRPDLRFGLTFVDVTSVLKEVNYKIFQGIIQSGGIIKGFNVKGQSAQLSKNVLQEELAKKVIPSLGAKGMTWMRMENSQLQSNIVQFFSAQEQQSLIKAMNAEEGDVLMFIADKDHRLVHDVLGRFRLYIGEKLGLIDQTQINTCWITEFPLFEKFDGKIASVHHPFTQPAQDISDIDITDEKTLLSLKARAYDLVINGEEIGGGSIRIHDPKMQEKIFRILGLNEQEIEEKFGFFVNAFRYGAPPHGGIALGVDRLVSMILGKDSIREVIAFPKNRVAVCPLTGAPDHVAEKQLKELHMKIQPSATSKGASPL